MAQSKSFEYKRIWVRNSSWVVKDSNFMARDSESYIMYVVLCAFPRGVNFPGSLI